MNGLTRCAGVLVAAALVETMMAGTAVAASGRTVYVDHHGAASAAAKGKCGKPNFATIRAAVRDVSVAHVVVCPGIYSEQVAVGRGVALDGRPGAVIQAPAVLSGVSGALVRFSGAQRSRLTGFTISGASTADPNLSSGVDVVGGADVSISGNHIRDIHGVALGSVQGEGIVVSQARAEITENTIERYGAEGVLVDSSSTFATVGGNTVRGPGKSAFGIGIDIRESGQGNVEGNVVTGNSEGGILVDETGGVLIRDNSVFRNGRGIVLGDDTGNTTVFSNVVRSNTGYGIFVVEDASGNTITGNEFTNNGSDGIHMSLDATGNTVTRNTVYGSGGTDILDGNGVPPANTYAGNKCDTSNPAGLC
jgi:parallel beta-helix repeat protein